MRSIMLPKRYAVKLLVTVIALPLLLLYQADAATYYVASSGNDNAAGSQSAPFATWVKGQTAAAAGDTVFFRGGTYIYTKSSGTCGSQTATVSVITLNKSGSSGKLIHYIAYPGEIPVFDFYGVKDNCRIRAVNVTGSWIHIKGLEMKGLPQNNSANHENWCVHITGSSNIMELLNTHHIMGPGVTIWGGDGNLVLNCDSHDNYDQYTSNGAGESADGFGCHTNLSGPIGNVFRGCRAWWNTDDGFDCISCDGPVLIENCWNWLNGYLPGTMTRAKNGNGFKLGGFGNPPSGAPSPVPQHTARNCVAFINGTGFYQNHHPADNYFYNNTAFNNGTNFNMLGYKNGDAGMGIYKNNIAFTGTATSNGPGTTASNNSWNLSPAPANSDFLSIDTTGVYGPRKANGDLPDVKFMHLAAGSKMIDKGTNVSLPFAGSAPDLGAYEYGLVVANQFQPVRSRTVAPSASSPQIRLLIPGMRGGFGEENGRTALFTITGKRVQRETRGNAGAGLPLGIYIVK